MTPICYIWIGGKVHRKSGHDRGLVSLVVDGQRGPTQSLELGLLGDDGLRVQELIVGLPARVHVQPE